MPCCSEAKCAQCEETEICPRCGQIGKAVEIVTLKSLLAPEAMKRLAAHAAYYFCKTAHCPVVYFSGTHLFTQDELTVRVYQKDNGDTVPVCYCFGLTREKIAGELERTAASTAIQQVMQYVREGKCACEFRNPQGSCCLGNLRQVVRAES